MVFYVTIEMQIDGGFNVVDIRDRAIQQMQEDPEAKHALEPLIRSTQKDGVGGFALVTVMCHGLCKLECTTFARCGSANRGDYIPDWDDFVKNGFQRCAPQS
jgi:hypothetical protein